MSQLSTQPIRITCCILRSTSPGFMSSYFLSYRNYTKYAVDSNLCTDSDLHANGESSQGVFTPENPLVHKVALWKLIDSNYRPSACKADALNQLSQASKIKEILLGKPLKNLIHFSLGLYSHINREWEKCFRKITPFEMNKLARPIHCSLKQAAASGLVISLRRLNSREDRTRTCDLVIPNHEF